MRTIAPALNLMEMDIAKAEWLVKIPEGHEDDLKEKAKFLETVIEDMEHTWNDFIRQAATFNRYGFAPVEKVYRRRTRANGKQIQRWIDWGEGLAFDFSRHCSIVVLG